jgi:hypothetical protein
MRSPFQKALSASFIALALGFAASASEIPGVYLPLNDVSLGGVANVNGNFTVTLPGNTVQPSVDGGGMLSGVGGALELHGAITADIDATASGSFSTTIPLATLPLAVIPVSGSVSILPIVGLIGTISGTVEAGARFAMIEQFETSFDLSLDSGGMHASQMGSPNNVHRFAKPVVSGSTQANVEISVVAGVTFQILFNGFPIGGPTAAAQFTIETIVDPTANPWWEVNASFFMTTSFIGPGIVLFTAPLGTLASFDVADAGGPFALLPAANDRWSRVYALGSAEEATSVHVLPDGFLVTGHGDGIVNRAYLAKLAADGTPVWEKRGQLLPFGSMRPVGVASAFNGDIVIGGSGGTTAGARLERLSSTGVAQWAKSFAAPAGNVINLRTVMRSPSDNLLFAGEILHVSQNLSRPFVAECDSSGTVLFSKEFDTSPTPSSGSFTRMVGTADGGLLLVGWMDYEDAPLGAGTLDQHNFLAVKLDANRALTFATVAGTTGWDDAFTGIEGRDGTFVIGGQTPSWFTSNVHAAMLIALSPTGTMQWSKIYSGESVNGSSGDTPYDTVTGIVAVDGGYVVSGTTGLAGSADSWLFGTDLDGVTTFFKSFRSDMRDQFSGIHAVGTDGFIAYGYTAKTDTSVPFATSDLWLARTSIDGYLDFAPQFGFDCYNDRADWGHANDIVAVPMPGALVDLTLTSTNVNQGYDAVVTTTTLLTQ